MMLEFSRLAVGLLILVFHRQIADYVMHHERLLVGLFRARGVMVPDTPSTETARNIYFGIGLFIVLVEMARIWMTLP